MHPHEHHQRRQLSGRGVAAALTLGLAAAILLAIPPASAHNTATVRTCESGTDCQAAVFAVCDPGLPGDDCESTLSPDNGPRSVTIRVSDFPANTTVELWWLNGPEQGAADCTQLAGRTSLGSVTTDADGKAHTDADLPPGGFADDWVYGANWVCATTASAPGDIDDDTFVADRLFTIYPA